ncbi:MAG: hypothetical protein QXJ33_00290 [Acidilobaceae archaeon]
MRSGFKPKPLSILASSDSKAPLMKANINPDKTVKVNIDLVALDSRFQKANAITDNIVENKSKLPPPLLQLAATL